MSQRLSAPQAATTRAARNLMQERQWSQADLAHALDMMTSTLRGRLYGHRRWTLDDLDRLALLGAEVPAFGEVGA
ncbi:helix-turn-helix domain-containing protein [Actinomyces faecalis]|uniref:helix-turn-helix domain-containing protein n=1 Tax=Actinomyces faecalis TaxID=2722820 RepID=UPI001557D2F3|nr:hypothetical protein [Actinomyces faecalis]